MNINSAILTGSDNKQPKKKKTFPRCSVAAVHVTRVLPVGWMVQPNHGQQAIFKKSVLTQAIHLYRNSQMDRLTGNYDVTYRACTMTDREGQTVTRHSQQYKYHISSLLAKAAATNDQVGVGPW